MAQRLLEFLDSRDDLFIQTEAVDATSLDMMAALIDGIPKSLGGFSQSYCTTEDFFICFSAVSGLFGNAGQTNYAG
jgi:KR domain